MICINFLYHIGNVCLASRETTICFKNKKYMLTFLMTCENPKALRKVRRLLSSNSNLFKISSNVSVKT